MDEFEWNKEKNEWLKDVRGISFEEITDKIQKGEFVDKHRHKNIKKYPNQQVYVVIIREYAYEVPFVQTGEKYFLKTIIPSRKATKKYVK